MHKKDSNNKKNKTPLVVVCAFPTKAESELMISVANTGEKIPKKSLPIYLESIYTETFLKDLDLALEEKRLRVVRLLFPFFIKTESTELIKILFRFFSQRNNTRFIFLKPNPAELFISYYNNYLLHNKSDKDGIMLNPRRLAEHFTKNEMLDSIRNFALIYSRIKSMSRCFSSNNLHAAHNEIIEFLKIKSDSPKRKDDFKIKEDFQYLRENLIHPIFNRYILDLNFFEKPMDERRKILEELMSIQSKYKIDSNILEACPQILDENSGDFIEKISSIIDNMIDSHTAESDKLRLCKISTHSGKTETMIYSP